MCFIILPLNYAMAGDDYISISHENDNLGGGTDRFYTSGARATWFNESINVPPVIDQMADKFPTFDLNNTTSTFYSIGHNIFTPEDISSETQDLDDRPWAAFLYGSVGLSTTTQNDIVPDHIDELEFTLGIVGPEALGKPVQRFVHKYISDSPSPRGWKNQLDFEPGFIISWQRRMPYAWHKSYKNIVHARVEPNFSVSLGNIYTYAGTGASFILSSQKHQDTPPRVRPALPGTGVFADNIRLFDWQIFAGVDARLVGRNIFLDGNTFSDSHSVDKKYFVGDANAGASLIFGDTRLSYTLNGRTKEFHGQSEESIFGSLTLTQKF